MKTKAFPIGTVVEINNTKAIIVGYTFAEEKNHLVRKYIVLPYPKGYTDENSMKVADGSEIQLVNEGYRSETAQCWLKYLDNIEEASAYVSAAEMRNYLNGDIKAGLEREE